MGENFEDRLLAYHMGWLDRAAMEELDAVLERDPAAAARSRELESALGPLEDWSTLPAADHLDHQILKNCLPEASADEDVLTSTVRFTPEPPARGRRRFPSLIEVITAAACVAMLVGVVVPSWTHAVAATRKAQCASNLKHIALAQGAYRRDHDDHLPFAGPPVSPNELNWLRERTPGVPRFRNSRNRFLLAREGYLGDTAHYVCPSDAQGIVMRVDGHIDSFSDFAERRNNSYDSQLILGSATGAAPDMVIYADPNPLFAAAPLPVDAPPVSNAHAELGGQNVLNMSGHVAWAISPNVGVHNDDIWRIGARSNYTGSEIPQYATDSFMIP